ncbi:hypothetical protein DAEQUDRAFT_336989 [Daedalea quercina L-15889]|uniref:Uncharacterized protein n=1 Tax=Daedalea quercina L-15889 TaxID=1314783 RepID=A0A165PIQ2_9APHY|nr:hypothetical protein DAEQUDRAFT_336989 [Daedalea quercina L-15889]
MYADLRAFTTPAYGVLRFALARKDSTNRNQYMLVFAEPYGMACDRRVATLNEFTSAREADAPTLSASGHPLIWFDCTMDLNPKNQDGILHALLQVEPPVIRLTGRTRKVPTESGDVQLVREVEILLGEDDLAHVCYYCGNPEFFEPYHRYKRCNSNPAPPRYICPPCEDQFKVTRNLRWALRRYWVGGL